MINALNIIIWSRRPILVTVVLGVFLDSPLLEKSTFRCCVDSEFFDSGNVTLLPYSDEDEVQTLTFKNQRETNQQCERREECCEKDQVRRLILKTKTREWLN